MSADRLEKAKALLARLVAFDSVSDQSNLPVIAFVEEHLASQGVAAHVDDANRFDPRLGLLDQSGRTLLRPEKSPMTAATRSPTPAPSGTTLREPLALSCLCYTTDRSNDPPGQC